MKQLAAILAVAIFSFAGMAAADTHVQGYYRSDGTHVTSHYRSDANNTVRDNYSYKGNTNPHTGRRGNNYYRNSPSYKGNTNPHTGRRGNNYYRNSPSSGYYGTSPSQRSHRSRW